MVGLARKGIISCLLTVFIDGWLGNTIAVAQQPTLQDTPWQLQSWSEVPSLVADTPVTIAFEENNLSGLAGCNRYRTSYQTKKRNLTINPAIASTRKACPEPIMSQEAQYLMALTQVERFEINGQGELKLTYRTKKGTGTLIFIDAQRSNPSPAPKNSSKTWLDQKNPTNWNRSGTPIPQAPRSEADANLLKRCQEGMRRPTTSEDWGLSRNGWMLFGPVQIYSGTTLITAAGDVDGMCRPTKYQAFIFVNGLFAGTLSPQLMDSRTDGAVRPIFLDGAANFSMEFNRYGEKDALCCPSQISRVSYTIERRNDLPLVVPVEVVTENSLKSYEF